MEVAEKYADQVRIVGVPGLAEVAEMQEFVEDTGAATIVHLADPDGEVWERFGVTRNRTYVLIDDDGSRLVTGYGGLEAEVIDLIAR